MADEFKYWAFLSYSHRDAAWGDWLHRSLETYRIPRHLVGSDAPGGAVPERLYPVFRDREELPSSSDLGEKIDEALRSSRNLLVLCSPHAARSRWVGQEVRRFQELGRADRVFCLIVDGEPGASAAPGAEDQECFPEPLRYEVDAAGALTDRLAEPIAADARPGKDGRRDALLKLVAGLLDVGFDELKQRDQARRIRQLQRLAAGAFLLAAVLVGLSVGLYRARGAEQVARAAAEVARDAAREERARAEARLREVYRQRGQEAYLAGATDQALFYFQEVRRLAPDAARGPPARMAATSWRRLRNLERAFPATERPAARVVLSPDGAMVLAQDDQGGVRGYSLASGHPTMRTRPWLGFHGATLTHGGLALEYRRAPDPERPGYLRRHLEVLAPDGTSTGRTRAWPRGWSDPEGVVLADSGARALVLAEGTTGPGQAELWDLAAPASPATTVPEVDGHVRDHDWDFSPGGAVLVQRRRSGSGPFEVVLRAGDTGKVLGRFQTSGAPGCLALTRDQVAVGTSDGRVALRQLPGGEPVWTVEAHRGGVAALAFPADGQGLLSAGTLGEVTSWDLATGEPTRKLRPGLRGGVIRALDLADDGSLAAVATGKQVLVLDPRSGATLSAEDWHADPVVALDLDGPRRRLATATERGALRVWRVPDTFAPAVTREPERPDPGEGLWDLVRDATGRLGATCGWGYLRTFALDPESGAREARGEYQLAGVQECRASAPPSGPAPLVVVADHGSILALGPEGAPREATIRAEGPAAGTTPWSVAFSRDGRRGAALLSNGALVEFELDLSGVRPTRRGPLELPSLAPPPELLGLGGDGGSLLLRQGDRILARPEPGAALRVLAATEARAATLVPGSPPRAAILRATGRLDLVDLEGTTRAQVPLPRPLHDGKILSGSQVRAGAQVLYLPDQALLATTVDERVFLVDPARGALVWRSPPVTGYDRLDLLGRAEDGALRLAAGGYPGGSYLEHLRLRLPAPELPDEGEVDRLLEGVLGLRLEDGRLVRGQVAPDDQRRARR